MNSTNTVPREWDPLLLLDDISKSFGSVIALSQVSFAARQNRVTALLGENGAGKTTLMRIAFGLIQPDSGSITVDGTRRIFRYPADAIEAGIGMVHQQFSLVSPMTVAENVALGGSDRYSPERVRESLKKIAEKTGLYLDPSTRVMDLSNAERQKLEIIRSFARNARVLILDEPTSVLTPDDRVELFRDIREFADDGNAVVLITHKLSDALEHSDDVVVLRLGQVVLTAPTESLDESSLATAMLGSGLVHNVISSDPASGDSEQIARLENVVLKEAGAASPRTEITVAIDAGEIIGVAALEGGGAEFLRVLARRSVPVAGKLSLPADIAFVPENRHDEALIEGFTLTENFALANASSRRGTMDWRRLESAAAAILQNYRVRAENPDVRAAHLSGGNQQRFILGRELRNNPSLLVLENPTQGLDVSAAAFVYEQARDARARGAAVIFYSTDLDELALVSDRVLVVSREGIQETPPTRDAIGAALLGTRFAK